MCLILDANSLTKFRDRDEDMEPVWYWLRRKNGKIVYSDTEKFRSEWEHRGGVELMRQLLQDEGADSSSLISIGWDQLMRQLQRRDKLKLVSAQDVQKKADELEQADILRSDDPHIIALAILADVKVLVVERVYDDPKRPEGRGRDSDLQEDFKNLVGGRVYQTKSHSRLLRKDTCP